MLRQGEALPAEGKILVASPDFETYRGRDWWDDRLFVSGIIRYMDDNGVFRRTAFYRVATRDLNRFVKPDFDATTAADHEYED